jgi:hypothetical protein
MMTKELKESNAAKGVSQSKIILKGNHFELIVIEINIRNREMRVISGYGLHESWSEAEKLPQSNQQNKTKQLGWCGIIIGKKKKPTTNTTTPHHHTTPELLHFKPLQDNLGLQPYSNSTRRNMEDDLNIFENGRQPQFLKEDNLIFF